MTTADDTPIAYTDALTELDEILRELESADVDVDHLADRVSRAAALITICRTKIANAQLQIDEVTAELDATPDGDGQS